MGQNNLLIKSVFLTCGALVSFCTYAQQPNLLPAKPPVVNGVPSSAAAQASVGVGIGNQQPGNVVVALPPSVPMNTLQKKEMREREKIESDLRLKELTASGVITSAPNIQIPVSNTTQLTSNIQVTSAPIVKPQSSSSVRKNQDEDGIDTGDFSTVSIINFKGIAIADINHLGDVSSYRVGDRLNDWTISRITIEGVQVQKLVSTKKVEKSVTKILKAYRAYAQSNMRSGATAIGFANSSQLNQKILNQDSTGIEMAGGILPPLPVAIPNKK